MILCQKDNVVVGTNTAQMFADSRDMPLFETSAKVASQNDHVESIFMTLVHKLKESRSMHVQSDTERLANLNQSPPPVSQQSCFCV